MKPNRTFGMRLFVAREGLGLTQKQFAERLGVGHAQVSNYESGRKRPTMERFEKMLDILGVDADWLLGRTNATKRT